MNSFVQPCVCAMKQCQGTEKCLNISSIFACEDVAESDTFSDKRVSALRNDALSLARFIGTSHSNVIITEYVTVNC